MLPLAEGGDVDSLAAQLAADGYDLDADWRELDRASSTTGRGKMNQDGGKGSLAQSRPTPADVLYAPPSNPRVGAEYVRLPSARDAAALC
eukprot:1156235-Pelagomonas_calceolata.AAC.13